MNNKFIFYGLLLGFFVFVLSFASAQEIVSTTLYNSRPLDGNNSCMMGASNPCLDTDSGYFPTSQSSVGSFLVPMSSSVSGSNTFWNAGGFPICILGAQEYCNASGYLQEFVCGSSVGIPNGLAFNAAFSSNFWSAIGEPTAIFSVDCAVYAANNPGLGLIGVCSSGACV